MLPFYCVIKIFFANIKRGGILLILGLLTFPDNMLAANEVPRIVRQFGLDSSVRVNMMPVAHATTTEVNLTRPVARATGK